MRRGGQTQACLWGVRLAVFFSVFLIVGCGLHYDVPPARDRSPWPEHRPLPRYYRVVEGDTLYAIAWRYRLDYKTLARWNAIPPPYVIQPNQRIRLRRPPWVSEQDEDARRRTSAPLPSRQAAGQVRSGGETADRTSSGRTPPTPSETVSREPTPQPVPAQRQSTPSRPDAGRTNPEVVSGSGWRWPVAGRVLRAYGASGSSRRGMDIGGEEGSAVRAARAGEVVYSGNGLVGYGELIIIKHDERYLSAYGFNQRRLVSEGEKVSGGQVIARMGTGPDKQPMLHFEVRDRGDPIDPIRVLPKR